MSALHIALAQHPQVCASPVKEPKYHLCWDAPHPPTADPAIRTVSRNGPRVGRTTRRYSRRLHRTLYAWRALFLSLPAGRPAPDRRGTAAREADRDRPRPDRSCVLQLDASVGRRAGTDRRLRRSLAHRRQPDRGRMGTVLALPPARPVRPAAE